MIPPILEQTVAENAWQVDDGLWRILLPLPGPMPFVNAFAVASAGEYMLIDCGMNWDPSLRALGRALKAIGVPDHGLTQILITHRHTDHAGGAGPVQSRWGGRTLLHPKGAAWQPTPPALMQEWLAQHGMDRELAAAAAAPSRAYPEYLPAQVDCLNLDAPLRLGDLRFEVIPVPGHAIDMVMLREPRRGWLLSADMLLPQPAVNVWSFPGSGHNPLGDYFRSLELTAHQAAALILPSHGMPRRGGLPAMVEAMAEFDHRFLADIRQAVQERRGTAWELVQRLRPQAADPTNARWAMGEFLAALAHLHTTGAIRQGPDGRWEAA